MTDDQILAEAQRIKDERLLLSCPPNGLIKAAAQEELSDILSHSPFMAAHKKDAIRRASKLIDSLYSDAAQLFGICKRRGLTPDPPPSRDA